MSATENFAPAHDTLRHSAQRLRAAAVRAGEPGLNLRVHEVLAALPMPYDPEPLPPDATTLDVAEAALEPLEFADGVLARHGIRCRPSLAAAGHDGVVTLRPTRRFAIQGAVLLSIAALVGGGMASKFALVGFVPFVIVGIGLVTWQMPRLDRWAPQFIPRGRVLGALVMLILLAISAVAVVQPLRERAREEGKRTNAIVLAEETETRLAAGDIAGALVSATGAMANDASAPGVENAYARANAIGRAQVADAETNRQAGKWDQAITQLESVGSFYNAPQLIEQVRHDAGTSLIVDAKTALAADDATAAFNAYNAAITYDPTVADPYLLGGIIYALSKR